jgi:uncharacterized Fe-S cluster-containing radical SAM superfamily protein
MPGGVATIETGPACNNRCGFCPYTIIRSCRPQAALTADELRDRVRQARADGCEEVAFSGGEPTIRPDLPEIVAYARSLGFRRVAVTTNGRRLAYRDYARSLLDAGLTGASVSLHGATAEVHDAITGVPGSFAQATAGLARLCHEAATAAIPLHLSTITVLVPSTLPGLRDTLVLAGRLGARLHLVQPFAASRENVHRLRDYGLDLATLVRGIERAVEGGLPHGGRLKPFNLPPCLLEHLGPVLELQDYPIRRVREHEDRDARPDGTAVQFFREPRCAGCRYRCPGFRIEHLPEDAVADGILEDAAAALAAGAGPDLVVGGTDLLGAAGLARLLDGLASRGAGRVRMLWGGFARSTVDEFLDACRRHAVDDVCLVLEPTALRLPDRRAWVPGNLARLHEDLGRFVPGASPRPSLFVAAHLLWSPDADLDVPILAALARDLVVAGGDTVWLGLPEAPDPGAAVAGATGAAAHAEEEATAARAIEEATAALRDAGVRVVPLTAAADGPAGWGRAFLRHRFTGPGYGWLAWSSPAWVSSTGS